MIKKRLMVILSLTTLTFLLLSSFVAAASGVSIILGPEQISTGRHDETPAIAVDSLGNVHIVWAYENESESYLMYKMVDKDGNVLIEETNVLFCAEPSAGHVRRPSIVVDSQNKLHVVYHGFSYYTDLGPDGYNSTVLLQNSEVLYLKLDPYLDDQDGDSTDAYTITLIPETIISNADGMKSRAPNIAIGPTENMAEELIHIAWWEGGEGDLESEAPRQGSHYDLDLIYGVMDLEGDLLGADSYQSGLYVDIDWGEPEIAVDSNGNAHIVYCTDETVTNGAIPLRGEAREVYYIMINGTDGMPLIDNTQLTLLDGSASVRPTIEIDGQDMVYVVWHDKRLFDAGTGAHAVFYSKLDPSLDDQDQTPADPTVISVVMEQMASQNTGYKTYLANLALDPSGQLHLTYRSQNGTDDRVKQPMNDAIPEIYYQLSPTIPQVPVTAFNGEVDPCGFKFRSSGRHPDIIATCDRVYVAFSGLEHLNGEFEELFENGDSYSDVYLVVLKNTCFEPVGGEIVSINLLHLIAPYLLLLTLVAGTIAVFLKKKLM